MPKSSVEQLRDNLTEIEDIKGQIRQAIIAKETEVPLDTPFSEYPQKIEDIQTKEDLSDATAQAQDIVRDKTAYTGNGKITGTFDKPIPIYESTDVTIMASRITGYQTTEQRIFSYIDNYFAYTKKASSINDWLSGIYCIEDSQTVTLATRKGYTPISIVDVIDDYIYYVLGVDNYVRQLELYRCSKDGTTDELYWTIPLSKSLYMSDLNFIDKSKLELSGSFYIELDIPNKAITKSYDFDHFGSTSVRALTTTIFTSNIYSSSPKILYKPSISLAGPNLSDYPRFVNAEENKIILGDNLYVLNSNLSIGTLIKEHIVTDAGLTVNDTYSFVQISGSYYWYLPSARDVNATGGKICKFDDDTNSFTIIYDCSYLCIQGGNHVTGFQCSFLDSSNRMQIQYVLPDSQTQVLKGYRYDGHDMYFDNSSFVYSSSILTGYTAYDLIGTTIIGTMPNNGALNYTPSTSQQTIPAGYTSGGTVEPINLGVLLYSIDNISSSEVTNPGSYTYTFIQNANGYYESNNKGKDNSFAMCKLSFVVEETSNVSISYINSGEANYDFGIFSNLDTTLQANNNEDTSNVKKSCKGDSSTDIRTLTYSNVSAGEHFIYIKFRKDGSSSSGNDSLQFKLNITKTTVYIKNKIYASVEDMNNDTTQETNTYALIFDTNTFKMTEMYKWDGTKWIKTEELSPISAEDLEQAETLATDILS